MPEKFPFDFFSNRVDFLSRIQNQKNIIVIFEPIVSQCLQMPVTDKDDFKFGFYQRIQPESA